MIGIIGGSGVYTALRCIKNKKALKAKTPYGTVDYVKGELGREPVIFVSRHGKLKYPPHRVNYKANIFSLKKLKVEKIISTSAVGTIRNKAKAGMIGLPDQLIDLTRSVTTFYEQGAKHADFTNPFCPTLRAILGRTARKLNLKFYSSGTYVCFSGPQFETSAEIKMAKLLGGSYIGMTVAPEAKLARELEICYQPIALIVNRSGERVTHEQNLEVIKKLEPELNRLIERAALKISSKKWKCSDCVAL